MAYKTLLTIVTETDPSTSALDAAVALARREDAHLDVLCLGIDRTQPGYYYAGATTVIQQQTIENARQDAEAVEQAVRKRLAAEDVKWGAESAVAQIAGLATLVASRARFSDLVIQPRPYGADRGVADEAIVEAALFDAPAPVLVVPGDTPPTARKVVVGWNESREALVAVRAALPVLTAAESVEIAIIDPPQHGPDRSDPGGALGQMLARHGARCEISVLSKTMPRISEVLMHHASETGADLVVMGAYGHSRFREAILGGATRNMLENTSLPVLMAH